MALPDNRNYLYRKETRRPEKNIYKRVISSVDKNGKVLNTVEYNTAQKRTEIRTGRKTFRDGDTSLNVNSGKFSSPKSKTVTFNIQDDAEYLRKVRDEKFANNYNANTMFERFAKPEGFWGLDDPVTNSFTDNYYLEDPAAVTAKHFHSKQNNSMYGQYFLETPQEKVNCKVVLSELGRKISDRLIYSLDFDRYNSPNHLDPLRPDPTYSIGRAIIKNIHFDNYGPGTINENGELEKYNVYKNLFFNMGMGLGESPVINPPFQWNERDDPRTHSFYTKMGRVWVEEIYTNFPMIMIMPGDIRYNTNIIKMIGFDGGAAARQAGYIRGGAGGLKDFIGKVGSILNGVGDALSLAMLGVSTLLGGVRLIEFRQRYNLYASYLSGLMKDMATAMGLINQKGHYVGRWANLHPTMILPGRLLAKTQSGEGVFGDISGANLMRSNQMLTYVIGKDVNVSESFNNSTKSNPMMEKLNSMAQENADDRSSGGVSIWGKTLNGLIGAFSGNKAAMAPVILNWGTRLAGNVSETALITSGLARMSMPDVWESSSFSRQFSISFKFHSPYGDKLSIFENVMIPTLSLIALVLPRQVGGFSYLEPFSIRAVMPGMFNINYGIVESLNIKRGEDQNDWTVDNLPKTISVDVTIKDFEPVMMMPLGSRSLIRSLQEFLFPASGISEYIVTMAGMSLADQLDNRKRSQRIIQRYKSGWADALNPDIMSMYISNTNTISNILGSFFSFSSDTIKVSESEEDRFDDWISLASKVSDTQSINLLGKAVKPVIGAYNFAISKMFPKSNGDSDPKITYLKNGEYYEDSDVKDGNK